MSIVYTMKITIFKIRFQIDHLIISLSFLHSLQKPIFEDKKIVYKNDILPIIHDIRKTNIDQNCGSHNIFLFIPNDLFS